MKNQWMAAALIVTGGLVAGCNNYTGDGQLTRQEGDYATHAETANQRVASPIQGDTTGGGLRRDARTGGGIDGGTVTGADRQRISPVTPDTTPGGGGAPGAQPGGTTSGTGTGSTGSAGSGR